MGFLVLSPHPLMLVLFAVAGRGSVSQAECCLSIKRFCLKNKRFIPDNEEIQGKTSHCRMIGCEFSPESSPFGAQLPQRAQGPAGGQEAAWAG